MTRLLSFVLISLAFAWPVNAVTPTASRTRLTAPITFYVATPAIGCSAVGPGTSWADAWCYLQDALDDIQMNYDLACQSTTVQLANSTGHQRAFVAGPFVGACGAGTVVVQGDVDTPANVVIDGAITGNTAFGLSRGAQLTIRGISLRSPGNALVAVEGGTLLIFDHLDFGPSGNAHIYVSTGATMSSFGPYSISGDAPYHYLLAANGFFDMECPAAPPGTPSPWPITINGTRTFQEFARIEYRSMLDHKRCTFVGGTVIGYKAVIFGYSVLHTAEPDWMNYLPGSLPVQHSTAYVD